MGAFSDLVAIVVCTVFDAALALMLLSRENDEVSVILVLFGHVLVATAGGFAVARVLPPFVQTRRGYVVAFGTLLATFVPVLGVVGMYFVFRYGLSEPRDIVREPWVTFDARKEAVEVRRNPRRARRRQTSALEIRTALRQRRPETADYRFQSVLAIKRLPPKVGVPLLKLAQSDPVDEVRLYAFSRLERMRDGLEKQVKELTTALETATEVEAARVHLRLAQRYWELGYLGLAEGAVLDHAMKSAHRHAAISCELMPEHAPAEFFLGRILVHLREPERALIAFERAIKAGYPRVRLLPWFAECAFYQRDFDAVRAHLRELEASSPENVFFQGVVDMWADKTSGRPPPPPGSKRSISSVSVRNLPGRARLT